MCGRFSLIHDIHMLLERFGLSQKAAEWSPRYNLAPTQKALTITMEGDRRQLHTMQWGLVPHWSKEKVSGYSLINARQESLNQKPTFKSLIKSHRCLVPADGFYEWQKSPQGKLPMRITKKDDSLFAFAGLWDVWRQEGAVLHSFTIITTTANTLLSQIHDRMPVILTKEAEALWLDPKIERYDQLQKLLIPYPHNDLKVYRVSPLINSWKVDSPDCIAAQ